MSSSSWRSTFFLTAEQSHERGQGERIRDFCFGTSFKLSTQKGPQKEPCHAYAKFDSMSDVCERLRLSVYALR